MSQLSELVNESLVLPSYPVTICSTVVEQIATGNEMANDKFVSYLRVSTTRQGESGLGLEAQRTAVSGYLAGRDCKLIREVVEVESGKRSDRPELDEALRLCRLHNATLIVGKLDRLARNARFLLKVVEESGKRGVVFCDLPHIPEGPPGKMIVTIMASVAEWEGAIISQRTRAGLAEAKARGTQLGGRRVSAERMAQIARESRPAAIASHAAKAAAKRAEVLPVIAALRAEGVLTHRRIASELNQREIPAPRGGKWSAGQVWMALKPRSKPGLLRPAAA